MHDLLPHYERELAQLRALAEEFAVRYPQVAGRMAVSGQLLQDPHVERLLQAFALLAARIRERLDDDHSLFAESYLGLLYPHYLRPLPACAIACFVAKEAERRPSASVLARGYEAEALLKGSGTCTFRTTAELQLLPLRIAAFDFRASTRAPDGTRIPSRSTSILSLQFELVSPQARWSELGVDAIRVYVDGSRALVKLLREVLASQVLATMVQTADRADWRVDDQTRPRGVGFDEAQALIDFSTGGHSIYRLLTEYFAFPEKFNFIDIPLPTAARQSTNAPLTLHFALGSLRGGADDMAVLQEVTPGNLRLGCVPVINLFSRRTSSQSILPGAHSHPLVAKNAEGQISDLYAIQQVFRVQKRSDSAEDEITATIPPFLSLGHEQKAFHDDASTLYWIEYRHPAHSHTGGTEIGFVDLDMSPVDAGVEAFAADVLATDRHLPSRIQIGKPGGDFSKVDSSWERITFLTQPTLPASFEAKNGKLWRLISQLSLNQLMFSDQGIEALKDILSLYELSGQATHRSLRDGLAAIRCKPVQGFIDLDGASSLIRGAEIVLDVNEDDLVDIGLHLFTEVLGRLFALCMSRNSFTQLTLVSVRTGQVLVQGERRRGEKELL